MGTLAASELAVVVEGETVSVKVGDVLVHLARLEGRDRMRDLDFAVLLGFAQPRDVRKVIKRMIGEEKLHGVDWRATVAQQPTGPKGGGIRTYRVTEAWLTREQCLLVATQSQAPKAWAVTELLVRVFDRVLVELTGPAKHVALPAPRQELAPLARPAYETFRTQTRYPWRELRAAAWMSTEFDAGSRSSALERAFDLVGDMPVPPFVPVRPAAVAALARFLCVHGDAAHFYES